MTEFIVDALVGFIGVLVGGGGVFTMVRARALRQDERGINQQSANEQSVLSFYAMWNDELKRLRGEIDKLHSLIGALEQEVVSLGGDPVRVRLELAKDARKRYDERYG